MMIINEVIMNMKSENEMGDIHNHTHWMHSGRGDNIFYLNKEDLILWLNIWSLWKVHVKMSASLRKETSPLPL